MDLKNNSLTLNESFVEFNTTISTFTNSSNFTPNNFENHSEQIKEYAFIAFVSICVFMLIFLFCFLQNFFCIVFKSLSCCSNDSFCYQFDYLETNSKEFPKNSSISEPLILNELKNQTNMNYYGVTNETCGVSNATSSNKPYETSRQPFDNVIYSTNTFKSFNKQLNNEYLDIYAQFGNVCETLNEMIARNEIERIQTNLSKSLQEIEKIQTEMLKADDKIDESLVEEIEEPIESLLPMPDLDSIDDTDVSKIDDITQFDEYADTNKEIASPASPASQDIQDIQDIQINENPHEETVNNNNNEETKEDSN